MQTSSIIPGYLARKLLFPHTHTQEIKRIYTLIRACMWFGLLSCLLYLFEYLKSLQKISFLSVQQSAPGMSCGNILNKSPRQGKQLSTFEKEIDCFQF